MKNEIITSDGDLEDELTEIWEIVSGDLLESLIDEWMSRSEWVIEHEGESDINSHWRNRNCIHSSSEQQGIKLSLYPILWPDHSGQVLSILTQIRTVAFLLSKVSCFPSSDFEPKLRGSDFLPDRHFRHRTGSVKCRCLQS
jgi:hypothetical protein